MLTYIDDADVLKQICDLIKLQVPETAVGKSNVLLKHLLRYLNSQEMVDKEGGGLSFFMLICTFLSETKEGIINNEDIAPVKLEKGKPSLMF